MFRRLTARRVRAAYRKLDVYPILGRSSLCREVQGDYGVDLGKDCLCPECALAMAEGTTWRHLARTLPGRYTEGFLAIVADVPDSIFHPLTVLGALDGFLTLRWITRHPWVGIRDDEVVTHRFPAGAIRRL